MRPTLALKFTALVAAVLIVGFSSLGLFFMNRQEEILLSDLRILATALAQNLASNSLYGLVTHDKRQLEGLLQSLSRIHDVAFSWIEDEEGQILASWGTIPKGLIEGVRRQGIGRAPLLEGGDRPPIGDGKVVIQQIPEFDGYWIVSSVVEARQAEEKEALLFEEGPDTGRLKVYGRIYLVLSLERVRRDIAAAKDTSMVIVALAAAAALFLTLMAVHYIVKPLVGLRQAADQVRLGRMPGRVEARSRDEIGQLAAAFNRMVEQVVSGRKALERAYRELEDTNLSLEAEVDKRTKELKSTIRALELARDETEAAYREIKHLYDLKQAFLRTASHELRTPLTAIKANVDFMLEYMADTMDGETRQMIQAVARNTENMRNMVENMLSMVRLEAGSVPLEMEWIDLRQKTAEVAGELKALQGDRRLDIDIPAGLKACWDAARFHDLCLNLLANAFKYTREDGRVQIRARQEGDKIHFQVIDNGVGMEQEHLEKIFEPFYQVRHSGQGSGLGLAIARAVVERHGGTIRVESRPGEGTTFTVTMPVDARPETAEADGQGEKAPKGDN